LKQDVNWEWIWDTQNWKKRWRQNSIIDFLPLFHPMFIVFFGWYSVCERSLLVSLRGAYMQCNYFSSLYPFIYMRDCLPFIDKS
jgi:hypothetical protein